LADKENKETEPEEDKLERLKVKATRLESLVADREAEIASRDGRISGLEKDVTQKDEQIASSLLLNPKAGKNNWKKAWLWR